MNHLANEKSPYLRQHMHNPVNWYPWGNEAFEKAKKEDKPIFLSIGYSTCYWCHVMEKDSFELKEVAEVLDKYFVSIKVDREERPDVDQIYMDTVVALTGHGGWPMSVFLTPEKKPFWGGTFFYRDQFIKILTSLGELWNGDRKSILENGERITEFLKARSDINSEGVLNKEVLKKAYQNLEDNFDEHFGGFGEAPKFPPSQQARFLLRLNDNKATSIASYTLDSMAKGGIYDHIEGGFSRYSVDEKWLVPHFEKMLYDNALLAVTYLEAYQVTKKIDYKEVSEGILNYLLNRMRSAEGGFYSAEDAGEVGKEGEFYVWSYEELKNILGREFKRFEEVFFLPESGNFEDGKIVISAKNWSKNKVKDLLETLKKERDKRERPHRDEKILTSWNGLTISALSKGFQALGDKQYLNAAIRCAEFIKENLFKEDILFHSHCLGASSIEGHLEDYAFLVEGLLNLYESSFDVSFLTFARKLQDIQNELFWDENGGYFFASKNSHDLIVRRKDYIDGATPSGNSTTLENLYKFSLLFPDAKHYEERFKSLLKALSGLIEKYPTGMCKALQTLQWSFEGGKEIAIVGNKEELTEVLYKEFFPFKVLAKPAFEGPTFTTFLKDASDGVYICERGACKPKIDSKKELLQVLEEFNSSSALSA